PSAPHCGTHVRVTNPNGSVTVGTNGPDDVCRPCMTALAPGGADFDVAVNRDTGTDRSGDPKGCLPYRTIRRALSDATAGTTIWVQAASDVYREDETFPVVIPDGVTLLGNP